MPARPKLLVPVSFAPNFLVSDRLPLISMLICSHTGSIISCVCSYGGAMAVSSVRTTLGAFENQSFGSTRHHSTGMFSWSSVVVGPPGRTYTPTDEWCTGYYRRRDLYSKHLNPEWAEAFFYFFYDRPLDCYPSHGMRDISTPLFRKLLRVTLSRYNGYISSRC